MRVDITFVVCSLLHFTGAVYNMERLHYQAFDNINTNIDHTNNLLPAIC